MIERVELSKYRGFADDRIIKLAPLTFLSGGMGSGKTTVMETIALIGTGKLHDRSGSVSKANTVVDAAAAFDGDGYGRAAITLRDGPCIGYDIVRKNGRCSVKPINKSVKNGDVMGYVSEVFSIQSILGMSETKLKTAVIGYLGIKTDEWGPKVLGDMPNGDEKGAIWRDGDNPGVKIIEVIDYLKKRKNAIARGNRENVDLIANYTKALAEYAAQANRFPAAAKAEILNRYNDLTSRYAVAKRDRENAERIRRRREEITRELATPIGDGERTDDLRKVVEDLLQAKPKASVGLDLDAVKDALGDRSVSCPGCGFPVSITQFLAEYQPPDDDDFNRRLAEWTNDLGEARTQLREAEDRNRAIEREQARRKALRDELSRLPMADEGVAGVIEKGAEMDAETFREAYELAIKVKGAEERRAALGEQIAKDEEELEEVKAWMVSAEKIRDDMINGAMARFELAADVVLQGTGFGFKFSRDGVFGFGLMDEYGRLRKFRSLSGGEWVICAAAFAVGLCTINDLPLKIVMTDDMERIHPPGLRLELARYLAGLQSSGVIDQVVLAGNFIAGDGHDEARSELESYGYKIIDL